MEGFLKCLLFIDFNVFWSVVGMFFLLFRICQVLAKIDANFEKTRYSECKLMIDETDIMHQLKSFTPLVDDEELELMELEAASTPFRCSEHLGSRGGHGCPLCKGL